MADESRPDGQRDLGLVLKAACSCIRRGDGWQASLAHYHRVRRHCEEIGIRGEPAITVALRTCLGEVTIRDLHARDDPGYDGLCEGHDLYEAAWFSEYVGRKMYLSSRCSTGG